MLGMGRVNRRRCDAVSCSGEGTFIELLLGKAGLYSYAVTPSLELAGVALAAELARHGDRPAILTGGSVLSYQELAGRVAAFADRLGTARRLVVLAADNSVGSLVAYLAALASGHPLILAPAGNDAAVASLVAAYDPDVIVWPGTARTAGAAGGAWGEPALEEVRPVTNHTFHPDLALLLSMSGSTGSPKLVRLSSEERSRSNAEAIATYLDISCGRPGRHLRCRCPDCYGLSVINSHLLRGAGIVLTDSCRWWTRASGQLFRNRQPPSFARRAVHL